MEVTLDVSAVPANPAGAGRYIADLARELAPRLGQDLALVTTRGDEDRWRHIAPDAACHPILPSQPALRLIAEQVVSPRRPARAAGTIWHGPHYTLPLAYRRGPRVVTVHDLSLLTHPEWHERSKVAYFGRMIPAATRRADHVLCVSDRTRRELLDRFDLDPGRVSVTPLGIDERLFRPPASGSSPVPALAGKPYVLVLGTAEPRKNLARVLAAFDRIADEFPDLLLAMAGQPGWKVGAVSDALDASPHRHRVVELGYVPDADLAELLAGARALCYPSLYEGFGLPVVEALACGAIVVTSTGTVMQDNAGDAAIYVDPQSDESIATGLHTALELPPEQRVSRIERGVAQASTFRWSRTADLTIAGYEQAAAHWERTRR